METTAPRTSPVGGILAALGGILAIVGSLLAWATVEANFFGQSQTQDVTGTEGGDGTITLVAGVIMLIAGIVLLMIRTGGLRRAAAVLAIVAGLVSAGIGIYDMIDIKSNALDDIITEFGGDPDTITEEQRTQIEDAFEISVGYGLYLVIAAGVIGLVGGILGLRGGGADPTATAVPPPPGTGVPPPPAGPPSGASTDTGFGQPAAPSPPPPPPAAPGETPPGGGGPPTGP